jgi:hypothetical protein
MAWICKKLHISDTKIFTIGNHLTTQGKRIEHLDKMPEGRLTKTILSYRPRGCSDISRPRKCWTEAATGLWSILERQKKNIHFNLWVSCEYKRRQDTVIWMEDEISRVFPTLYSSINIIYYVYCCSYVLQQWIKFKNIIGNGHIMTWSCVMCNKLEYIVAYLRHTRIVTSKHAPRLRNRRRSGVFSVPCRW